jgi:effector-binding domain-containing protein
MMWVFWGGLFRKTGVWRIRGDNCMNSLIARWVLSVPAAALILSTAWLVPPALAQSPVQTPAQAPAETTPADKAAAETGATPAPATPANPSPAPADPAKPATEQPSAPSALPSQPAETKAEEGKPDDKKPGENAEADKPAGQDPFGAEVILTPKPVLMVTGEAKWDSAFDSLTASFKTLANLLEAQKLTPMGPYTVVYTSTDDTGFTFFTSIPVAADVKEKIKDLPKGVSFGQSPEGKALKFVHRGSYDNMDNTYEAITNHLEERGLEARDMFIEEYVTDPLKTVEDKLVINVFVPLK